MPQQDCSTILQPLSQSELTSLTNLPSINYTNQDFFSMKSRLVKFIQERFTNDFSDFIESDLGIMLIENWAFIADTLSFKMDQIVNELFIDTVTEPENAFRLAKLIGFQPTPPIAARALFSATIPSVLATDLLIDPGISFSIAASGQTISFELFQADSNNNPIFDEPITITAGNITNTSIVGLEGSTRTDNFTADGSINATLATTGIPVIFDSVRVSVDGTQWTQVDFFSDQPNNEFIVQFTSAYQAFIIFGNGSSGRVPTVGSAIAITYRVGGGTIGNIISGFIQQQRGIEVPGFNFEVPVTFVNYTKGEFGYVGDTIDDIRRKLPRYVKVQDRAVTGEDYEVLAEQYVSPYNGQIGKALAVLRNYGCAANIIDLFVLAKDGANGLAIANDMLKAELYDSINSKKMLTDYVCIRDGVVLVVDVVIDLVVDKFFRKFQQQIQNGVNNAVNDFFTLNNWDFGKSLKDTELMKALAGISEVKDISVHFMTNDPNNSGSIVVAQYFEVIRNDTTTVNLVFE
jgi:hypothetical protein